MNEGTSGTFQPTASDLWDLENWRRYFPDRRSLAAELALLERVYPWQWRFEALREPTSRHQLRGDVRTIGGLTRLLTLARELRQVMKSQQLSQVPMQGRLRCAGLYEPTKSELLVGRMLRSVGNLVWQPAGTGFGADYEVSAHSGIHIGEVKRLCTSRRQEKMVMDRALANMTSNGALFTRDEQAQNEREDAVRLYRRVHHAGRQLLQSAGKAARHARHGRARVSGTLFLDLDGHPYLGNIRARIQDWMDLPWARSIDLVVLFDYGCREDRWGIIAEPIYSRRDHALETLDRALPVCSRGHFHVGNLPAGPCEFPLPL